MKLQPEWVGELLGLWAARDWHDAQHELGFPDVSPMFARAVGNATESEDVTGYSSAEMRAVMAAIDWLQLRYPDHWRAVSRQFRPWTRATLERREGDEHLVQAAGQLIAKYIDDVLG